MGNFNLNQGDVMRTTETQESTATKLERIAWLSKRDKEKKYDCLMHYFNEASLKECYHQLASRRAVGTDRVTKEVYGQQLEENLKALTTKMKQMSYRPEAVREVLIPKEGKLNAVRPLGISNFEDKIVQKMMQKILEAVYEPIFLECSYGFRPGIGCHDAIRDLRNHLYKNPTEVVLDIDMENFFNSINHKELEVILREKIKDQKLMRYIIRMFKAGVLSKGELMVGEEGVMQGSICSPILANIFAHYVIDEWFEKTVRQHCRGQVKLFRYCDDLCITCEHARDAERIRAALTNRLNKYRLKLNEEKTQMVNFKSSNGKKAVFNFLGFTFYWGKSRNGRIIPKVKTEKKRMRSKLNKMKEWIKGIRNKQKLKVIWEELKRKVEGHIRYYGVSFNIEEVERYIYLTTQLIFKWLNRRSQKKSFDWEQFNKFMRANPLPKVRVCHKLF